MHGADSKGISAIAVFQIARWSTRWAVQGCRPLPCVPEPLSLGEGVGLDDYLSRIGPATARRIDGRFRSAIAAVEAIDGPLEVAIGRQAGAVDRAHAECRALEILLKTGVASVLGVTLTFKATDGD